MGIRSCDCEGKHKERRNEHKECGELDLEVKGLSEKVASSYSVITLLPSIKGLRITQEGRALPEVTHLELTNIMIKTNRLVMLLEHLHRVIGDLQNIQFQEYTCHLTTSGEFGMLEDLVSQVV